MYGWEVGQEAAGGSPPRKRSFLSIRAKERSQGCSEDRRVSTAVQVASPDSPRAGHRFSYCLSELGGLGGVLPPCRTSFNAAGRNPLRTAGLYSVSSGRRLGVAGPLSPAFLGELSYMKGGLSPPPYPTSLTALVSEFETVSALNPRPHFLAARSCKSPSLLCTSVSSWGRGRSRGVPRKALAGGFREHRGVVEGYMAAAKEDPGVWGGLSA